MLALALAGLLAQAPPSGTETAVVVVAYSRSHTVPERQVKAWEARLISALAEAGVPSVASPEEAASRLGGSSGVSAGQCNGWKECLLALAARLHARALVTVDMEEVERDVAVRLEAVATEGGGRLAKVGLLISRDIPDARLVSQLAGFAHELAEKLPPPKPAVPDAPVRANLEPAPSAREEVSLAARPGAGRGIYAAGISALGLGLAAGGFAIAGAVGAGQLDNQARSGQVSALTYAQAHSLASSANTDYTVAAVAGGAAALAAGLTWYFWTR